MLADLHDPLSEAYATRSWMLASMHEADICSVDYYIRQAIGKAS